MDTQLDTLFARIDEAVKAAQKLAEAINRGTGGREVALTITKLQEARMWAEQAEQEMHA